MATDNDDDLVPFQDRLRRVLGRLSAWLLQRRGPLAVKTEDEEAGGRWPVARAHFWTEFREGQREAEAHSTRRR
jgi:hypothetical protein